MHTDPVPLVGPNRPVEDVRDVTVDLPPGLDGCDVVPFGLIPDAPFTKRVLRLKGGNKGLLQNSRNICKQAFRATVQLDAHNGKVHDFRPVLRANCTKKSKRRKR